MTKIRSKRLSYVLGVVGGAAVLVLGAGTNAFAASGSASGTGVSASASWSWSGCCTINNISQSVSDTKGDSHAVYAFIRVYTGLNPDGDDIANLRNDQGYNSTVTRSGRYWEASSNISGVRVIACVDDAGSDTCYKGSYIDNPNT
ncbi:hypothetical protein ABZ920_29115 [Streptomyces sp. NPDC046831]|uniref:hypothetical protein n=1 Tax=Streptomyces sp. NPDC046831 TaxID=3154805 RepID=UPI0033D52481